MYFLILKPMIRITECYVKELFLRPRRKTPIPLAMLFNPQKCEAATYKTLFWKEMK